MATQATPVVEQPPRRAKHREWPWWFEPLATIVALGGFGVYSVWEVLAHNIGRYQNYLSPFFSPDMRAVGIHLWPALYVIWAPLLFRATCYYYRKEYYRGFFFDPPACAVPDNHKKYHGETVFPFSLNNLHRFFFYFAVIVLLFLWKDAIQAFFFPGTGFGVGLGSLIMLGNVILLSYYTFSCHAFRHLVGGGLDCFSCAARPRTRYGIWRRVSAWNARHGNWAWISMFSVWATDLYIRLLINGAFHDPRFF